MLTDYHAKYIRPRTDQTMRSDSVEKLAGALVGRPGRSESPPGRSGAVRVPHPAVARGNAGRRSRTGQDHRSRLAHFPEMGRAGNGECSSSRPRTSASSGTRNSPKSSSCPSVISWKRNHTTQRSEAGNFRPFDQQRTPSSSARTSLPGTKAADVRSIRPGISWSSMKPTACATFTSRPTSSPTPSSRRWPAFPKLLLTATPLQNSLLELFGLVSFIDEHAFGDLKSFREQFANLNEDAGFSHAEGSARADLPSNPPPPGHCTTFPSPSDTPLVEEFTPEESEDRLYDWFLSICGATTCRPPLQPALADDTGSA